MSGAVRVVASDGAAGDAALQAVHQGASPLRAVLSGYMAAVGTYPGVLMSPLTMAFTVFGAKRALDGRVRQPGIGAQRPRGFLPEEEVPDAARVGAATSLLACHVALSYDKSGGWGGLLRVAIRHARRAGAERRAQLLEGVAKRGLTTLGEDAIVRAFLMAAGPVAGGLLTRADLLQEVEVDTALLEKGPELVPAWYEPSSPFRGATHGLVACDRRGTAAAVTYGQADEGVRCEGLELLLPLVAEPVLRGVPRTRPGAPLPGPCAVRLLQEQDRYAAAAGVDGGDLSVSTRR
jgi:hypothetical protein